MSSTNWIRHKRRHSMPQDGAFGNDGNKNTERSEKTERTERKQISTTSHSKSHRHSRARSESPRNGREKTRLDRRSKSFKKTNSGKKSLTTSPNKRKVVPKNLLSFGEEIEEATLNRNSFSISKSTAKRFAKERTLVLPPAPTVGQNCNTSGLKVEDVVQLAQRTHSEESKCLTHVCFGEAQGIGSRPYMEDRHTVIPDFQPMAASGARLSDGVGRSFAGVYDGHNGTAAADAASSQLHLILAKDPFIRLHTGEGPPALARKEENDIGGALKKAFCTVDDQILQHARSEESNSGSTAVVAFRLQNVLYTANAGDSRAVLCRKGAAIEMTRDHKPNLPAEKLRIESLGGRVEFQFCWRVVLEGTATKPSLGLAVSRCLGDLSFKEPRRLVESEPEIRRMELNVDDEFVLMASDGVWDVMSSQEAVDCAREELTVQKLGSGLSTQCSESAAHAAAKSVVDVAFKRRTMDNVTCVIMAFNWG